jgi:hypothetical protein
MRILGAKDPLGAKLTTRSMMTDDDLQNKNEVQENFKMEGMENFLDNFIENKEVKEMFTETIKSYLALMAHRDYTKRPSVDDCLAFFKSAGTVLEKYQKQKNTHDDSRWKLFTKSDMEIFMSAVKSASFPLSKNITAKYKIK